MSDLVPEEAIKAAVVAAIQGGARGTVVSREWNRRVLEAAAPLILAAELEQLAGELGKRDTIPNDEWDHGHQDGMETAAAALRVRASVLRGEGDRNG